MLSALGSPAIRGASRWLEALPLAGPRAKTAPLTPRRTTPAAATARCAGTLRRVRAVLMDLPCQVGRADGPRWPLASSFCVLPNSLSAFSRSAPLGGRRSASLRRVEIDPSSHYIRSKVVSGWFNTQIFFSACSAGLSHGRLQAAHGGGGPGEPHVQLSPLAVLAARSLPVTEGLVAVLGVVPQEPQ